MDMNECNVKALETKTSCHLFSEGCIVKITKHQWESNMPEPDDWHEHDEAVLDLLGRVGKQVRGHNPRIIAGAIQEILNNELQDEPEILANLIAFLGFVLDGKLRHGEQVDHARAIRNRREIRTY